MLITILLSYKRKFNFVKRNINGNLIWSFIFFVNFCMYDFCSSFSVSGFLPTPLWKDESVVLNMCMKKLQNCETMCLFSWLGILVLIPFWCPALRVCGADCQISKSRNWEQTGAVGLLRVLLIKQIFRNCLIRITSAKQRSGALSDAEQQSSSYQMVLIRWCMWESAAEGIGHFCHVPLWTFRKKQRGCKKLSLFCALLRKVFLAIYGLTFHKERLITQT